MKTKTELYKDWAENCNLKTGKMFYFMYWSLIVYIMCVLLLSHFGLVITLSFKYLILLR